MHVDHGASAYSPCGKKMANVGFRLGVIPWSPAWIRKPLLYIDDQQCGMSIEYVHNHLSK